MSNSGESPGIAGGLPKGNYKNKLFVALFQRNLVNSQHPGGAESDNTIFFQCRKPVEYLSNRGVTEAFTHRNSLAGSGKTGLIDVHFKGSRLPAMGVHEGQLLRENFTTTFTFEPARQKMQEGLFAPNIQMSDTSGFFLMNFL